MSYEGASKLLDIAAFTAPDLDAGLYSIGYKAGTRTLLQQTANHTGAASTVSTEFKAIGGTDYRVYTRWYREISSAGVISAPVSQFVSLGEWAGSGGVYQVYHIRGAGHLQIARNDGIGSGLGTAHWKINGQQSFLPQPIEAAFGTNHHQAGGPNGNEGRMYVSTTGYVYIFQEGSGGDGTTCIARYIPGSQAPNAAVDIESKHLDNTPGVFCGHDLLSNIYIYRHTGDPTTRQLYAYTAALDEKLFEINLPSTLPGIVSANWNPDAIGVINNGQLLVAAGGDTNKSNAVQIYDISDRENLVHLGAVEITPDGTGGRNLWPVADCEVFFRDGESLWRLCPALSCESIGVDQIVYDLARRAGIPSSRIDVAALAPSSDFPDVWGMGVGRPASARQLIELLQAYSFFDVTEQGGIIRASRRDRDPDGTIGGEDLRAHAYGEEPPTLAERERTEDYEIPRETRVQYLQALAEYEPGVEAFARRVTDAEGVVDIDLSSIAMEPDRAAVIAEATMLEAITARESISVHLTGTEENKALKAGAIKTLEVNARTDVVRLVELNYAFPGLLRVKALRHDPTVYSSDAVGVGRRGIGSLIIAPGPTDFELLDVPLVREHDDVPGYFAALGGNPSIPGIIEGWPGGDLERLEAAGWEAIERVLRPGCVLGFATSTLSDGPYTVVDVNEFWISQNGVFESVDLQAALLGANLAALEVRDAGARVGWELLRFLDADYDATAGEWRLSNLIRGAHGTEWATGLHQTGDRFVLLSGTAQIITDVATELNLSRLHNAATLGATSNPANETAFAWTGIDRKPYAPVHVHGQRDTNDDILLDWTRRDRVGMELQSGQTLPLSEDAEEYEVDIIGQDSDGDVVLRTLEVSSPEATYTAAQQTADFGSLPGTITVAVYQLGALGRGYPATVTLAID